MATALAPTLRPAPVDGFLSSALLLDGSDPCLRSAAFPLRATYESVAAAREFVRRVARSWRLEAVSDDLALVATELVANALRHGLGLPTVRCPRTAKGADDRQAADVLHAWDTSCPVEVSLFFAGSRLMCVVDDPSTDTPVRRTPDLGTGSGRGLQLIDSLSMYWGWTVLERENRAVGKAVWAVFAVDGVVPEARAG